MCTARGSVLLRYSSIDYFYYHFFYLAITIYIRAYSKLSYKKRYALQNGVLGFLITIFIVEISIFLEYPLKNPLSLGDPDDFLGSPPQCDLYVRYKAVDDPSSRYTAQSTLSHQVHQVTPWIHTISASPVTPFSSCYAFEVGNEVKASLLTHGS
jgi:hypothetical protein